MKNSPMITKANGDLVPFDERKLMRSLQQAGASKSLSRIIVKKVKSELYHGIPTSLIYANAYDLLRESSNRNAGRYKLKQAILELGPSGFPFEQFVAQLLKSQGFTVETNLVLKGKCIRHEVDVKAVRDEEMLLLECKYHSQRGQKSDVKIALYVKARFQDIEENYQQNKASENPYFKPWLVTNTRFSQDAENFGRCAGLHLLGWDFPERNSLKAMIEASGLYPITCLASMNQKEKQLLLERNVVLCREIRDDREILDRLGMKDLRKTKVLAEIDQILGKEVVAKGSEE